MRLSAKTQYQGEEESGRKKNFSFFEDSPLHTIGNGAPNALSDTLLEHKKADIANKLEALRKATAKIHLNKNFHPKEQTDEGTDDPFPTQDARQKRGGNKLRKRTVADCLKVYCEPVGKSHMYKASSQVKTSAHGFAHQFTSSKVNSALMNSIKSDLNKSKKFFVSRSEDNDNQLYSKYFNQAKLSNNKVSTPYEAPVPVPKAEDKDDEENENYDDYFEDIQQVEKELEDSTKSDTKL